MYTNITNVFPHRTVSPVSESKYRCSLLSATHDCNIPPECVFSTTTTTMMIIMKPRLRRGGHINQSLIVRAYNLVMDRCIAIDDVHNIMFYIRKNMIDNRVIGYTRGMQTNNVDNVLWRALSSSY